MQAFRRLFEDGGQPDFEMSFIHSGGESSKKAGNETAFRWREVSYHTYIHITWPQAEKWLDSDMRGFLSKMKLKLQPYLIDENAAFANFPDVTLLGDVAEQAYL